jgi:hypothetical protein
MGSIARLNTDACAYYAQYVDAGTFPESEAEADAIMLATRLANELRTKEGHGQLMDRELQRRPLDADLTAKREQLRGHLTELRLRHAIADARIRRPLAKCHLPVRRGVPRSRARRHRRVVRCHTRAGPAEPPAPRGIASCSRGGRR